MNDSGGKPWIGRYYTEGWDGVILLVLGESSYGDKPTAPCDLVRHHIEEGTGHWCRTYTRFLHLLDPQNSALSDAEQRRKIWDRLAFYNYLTEVAGTRPRTPPLEGSWERSERSFFDFLQKLDPPPDGVIVWGYRLWYALEKKRGWLKGEGNNVGMIYWPGDRSKSLRAFALKHPSTRGMKDKEWALKLAEFLGKLRHKKSAVAFSDHFSLPRPAGNDT
jgi:hypothetical protein